MVDNSLAQEDELMDRGGMRVAVEGCGHGTLDAIYSSIQNSCAIKGWDGVDLVIIGGDFQAVRDKRDLGVTAMPAKYRQMADFHQYYWGLKTAPYLTIFIGGNHEASNHLFELYYGGWVAPNIYYLGAANIIQVGPLKIAGMSGIWKGYDYRKPHYERLPYSDEDMYSIYHVRELDVRKLMAFRSQVDVGMSHDWPKGIEWLGNHKQLFKHKPHLQEDAESGKLGNTAAQKVMDRLRPLYWFSAHLHTKYVALKHYNDNDNAQHAIDSTRSNHGTETSRVVPLRSVPHQEQLSAWNTFGTRVRKEEAEETSRSLEKDKLRQEEADRTGMPIMSNYVFTETFKKVRSGNGLERDVESVIHSEEVDRPGSDIPQLDGCCASLPLKRRRESSTSPNRSDHRGTKYTSLTDAQVDGSALASLTNVTTTNPDAIDIDTSDDEATPLTTGTKTVPDDNSHSAAQATHPSHISTPRETTNGSKQAAEAFPMIPTTTDPVAGSGHDNETSKDVHTTSMVGPNQSAMTASIDVSEEMRAQLAALSNKFEESTQVSARLPHPEAITNSTTRFLALSKCEDRQNFLQLLEIEPFEGKDVSVVRPVQLQYVHEWLAISRAFSSELTLGGNPGAQVPQHRGDTFYRDRIIEEEEWVQKNIVEKNLLNVPANFTRCIADYDAIAATNNEDSPREVTNLQTSAFCKLIGIDNPFDASEEERDARMAADASTSNSSRGRGRGGQRRSSGRARGGHGHGGRGHNNSFSHRGRGRGRGRH